MKVNADTLLNVLVVSGGGFQGLGILKGLLQSENIRIVLADCYEENIGKYFAHRSYVVPLVADEEKLLDELLKICDAETINVIFPSTEIELPFLAQHKSAFTAKGVRVAVSNASLLNALLDKGALYASFLPGEGLPAPEIIDISEEPIGYPVLGKPRHGWGGKGHLFLHSATDLKQYVLSDLQKNYVWQPYVYKFKEYSIDFAINFSGAVSNLCIRERLRTTGGFAVIAELVTDPSLMRIAREFAKAVAQRGGCGLFNLQIIKTPKDCFISDVNPRIGTSSVFAYGIGLNLPLFVCGSKFNSPLPELRQLTMVRYLTERFIANENFDKVRGIVFDLDDTLISQKRWILDKLKGLYQEFTSRLPDQQEFLTRAMFIVEEGNRSKLIDALAEHFALSFELKRDLIAAYRKYRPRSGMVFTDVFPLLAELKKSGYKLAVLTNNPPESQRQKIAACGFQELFDDIVYAREIHAEKPHKAGFIEAADRLKLSPHELIKIGDNLYRDIIGALQAGYQHAFLLNRPGGFFNFDLTIFEDLMDLRGRFTKIDGLREVLPYLR